MNYEDNELTFFKNSYTPFDKEEKNEKNQSEVVYADCFDFKYFNNCKELKPFNYLSSYPIFNCNDSNKRVNAIINKFEDFTEICFYKRDFFINTKQTVSSSVDRSRKWIRNDKGVLVAKDNLATIEKLSKCILNSRKRALDNLFGYVLCNKWDYFVTVTFKHGKNKKLSDDIVKYQWKKFRQQLQYKYSDINILLVPEDTPTGNHGMHFHGFIGNADIGEYLCPARNNDKKSINYGDFLYTKYGDPIFNFMKKLTNAGFTTVVKLKDNNRLKLVNYMTKYMHKDSSNFDYNENSYLHTNNLNFKDKQLACFSKEEMQDLINSLFAVPYKETDKMFVYRIFNTEV